jgi:hypothetical protein
MRHPLRRDHSTAAPFPPSIAAIKTCLVPHGANLLVAEVGRGGVEGELIGSTASGGDFEIQA